MDLYYDFRRLPSELLWIVNWFASVWSNFIVTWLLLLASTVGQADRLTSWPVDLITSWLADRLTCSPVDLLTCWPLKWVSQTKKSQNLTNENPNWNKVHLQFLWNMYISIYWSLQGSREISQRKLKCWLK